MGEFLNSYVKDLQALIPLGIGAVLLLVIFSLLYNHWMTALAEKKDGYTALLVAFGNLVTLLIVAVFSWKAAFLCLLAFVSSGTAMIVGDIYRSTIHRDEVIAEAKKAPRRKPLPYVASRLIADAIDELLSAENKIGQAMGEKKHELIPLVAVSISKSLHFLSEAKNTEGE